MSSWYYHEGIRVDHKRSWVLSLLWVFFLLKIFSSSPHRRLLPTLITLFRENSIVEWSKYKSLDSLSQRLSVKKVLNIRIINYVWKGKLIYISFQLNERDLFKAKQNQFVDRMTSAYFIGVSIVDLHSSFFESLESWHFWPFCRTASVDHLH